MKLELDMVISIGWFWFLLAVVLGLVGIFLNFLGHRYFKTGRMYQAFVLKFEFVKFKNSNLLSDSLFVQY